MQVDYCTTLHHVQERHWWYAARRTILEGVMRDVTAAGVPPGRIYDLGCGVGANLSWLERFGEVTGVDTSPEAVAFARQRGHRDVRQADLDHLEGLEQGSASVVVLADVIEHLADEDPCLEATRRLLKPGGAVVITVPAFMFLWGPFDDINHHHRRYNEAQLRSVVGRHFTIERTTYFNTFLFGFAAAGRVLERVLGRDGDESANVPAGPINRALQAVFAAEAPILRRHRFPFGVSILCVARKTS